MKHLIFCMVILFLYVLLCLYTWDFSAEIMNCCRDKLVFLEAGEVHYDTTSVKYPCPDVSGDGNETFFWVALLSVGALLCVCCCRLLIECLLTYIFFFIWVVMVHEFWDKNVYSKFFGWYGFNEITYFGKEYCHGNLLNLLSWRSVPIIDVNGAKNWKQV